MGIYEDTVTTDKLGRRSGPRARYTIEEKLRIVQETCARGASVALVARRHGLNANQVSSWRRLHRRGLLMPKAAADKAKLLPVTVSTPTVMPTERVVAPVTPEASAPSAPVPAATGEVIEIRLRNGHSIVVRGVVESEALSRVIDLLVQR